MSSLLIRTLVVTAICTATLSSKDCIVVADGVVRLRDITPPGTVLAAGLGQDRGDDFVFAAPAAGTTRWLSSEERARLLGRRGVGVSADATLPGICIRSASRVIGPDEWRLVILQAFASNSAFQSTALNLEVVDWSRYPVPEGNIELPLSALPLKADGTQPVLWRGSVRLSTGRSVPVWVKAKLTIDCTVVVASRSRPAGHRMDEPDFTIEKRAVFPTQAQLSRWLESGVSGKVLRRAVNAGEVLRARDLMEPAAVQPGQLLAAEVHEGAVRLKVAAIAETQGRIGETIWLRSSSGKSRFRGTVLSSEQVRVVPEVAKHVRKTAKEEPN